MEVTIIGTGDRERGSGSRVLAGRHDLTVVGKTSERARALVADIARVADEQFAHQLARKVVVDVTSSAPLSAGPSPGPGRVRKGGPR